MNRRQFISHSGASLGALGVVPNLVLAAESDSPSFESKRPPLSKRKFTSQAVERTIQQVKAGIADPELAWMFENCYPNTLDTTVDYEVIGGRPDTFVITGDIDAMWLRDSTAQVWPYMPLIGDDKPLQELIHGLINRQTTCILTDPYAEAFYKDPNRKSEWESDKPPPGPGVHERKWEVDSICYPVRLAHRYYRITGDSSVFDAKWDQAMRSLVNTLKTEQRKDGTSPYFFIRKTTNPLDAPMFDGKGRPIKPTGLICSIFRPSDDATLYPFLIPSNMLAAMSLRQLAEIHHDAVGDGSFAGLCNELAAEVEQAIRQYAIAEHSDYGEIYVYEVDGFGNKLFMDDANVPSLMSLAYLKPELAQDPLYQNTRRFLLSDDNPYFLRGTAAEGQASPHTGKDNIWPMGIILRAMTSSDKQEIAYCLRMLRDTNAGTGFMHESFDKDDPSKFTRSWFAWANTLFGELIIKIQQENPSVLSEAI